MKYVVMFTSRTDLDAAVPPERAQEVYGRIYEWFGTNAEVIADGGAQLEPVSTATTVRYGETGPEVVDGPFVETKEVVGGFSILDVPDLDAAIAVVRTWPALELPGVAIEIRPMVTDYSEFE